MSDSTGKALKVTGIGCLVAFGLLVLSLGGSYVFIRLGGDHSISTREAVEHAYPTTTEFVPPADGGFLPERMARFLIVRHKLFTSCDRWEQFRSAFVDMDSFEEEENVDAGDFFSTVGRAVKGMFGVSKHLNSYLVTRNETLLDQEMGMGEYTWLYVVIYHGWLGHPAERFFLAREDEPAVFADRALPEVHEMVARLCDSGGPDLPAFWQDELAALKADPRRVPFADGLPESITAQLEPYRIELENLFCPVICELDLTRTEREGIGYEHF